MRVRSAFAAAVVAASIAAASVPAAAQEVQTFDAWGHTFNVPGARSAVAGAATARKDAVPRKEAVLATGSVAPRHAYASARAGAASENAAVVHEAPRTINVWGARVDARVD
ncbi:hypothetical protein [Methylobacterium soli]|uniref:DUF4148 domain-containing protein n=1 Tax=Methylobacterium soli TaxID=553447 RepID=A0A6L3T3K0_9HYPH|nr:hypothetical protein [Methylobacterium soli]KAB1079754.1 hypothetical protein F6X53_08250 [Methylobacterium soli]GJE45342.1 hypothetical protein AEGHOMDF_4536 [Methylobacterium soli]